MPCSNKHALLLKGTQIMQKYQHFSLCTRTKHYFSVLLLPGILILWLFLFTACDNNSTTTSDSRQLLNQAQAAMKQVNSYHFTLTTDHPGTGSGIELLTADGDTQAPDKVAAKSTVSLAGITTQVKIIAIGQKQYYTDPLTGQWTPITSVIDPSTFADPQSGIGTILGQIQQPGPATDSSVDGKSCWSITGKLSTQYIARLVGSSPSSNSAVDTTVCIGKSDHLPYQIQLKGVAIQGDTSQTIRTIKLSKFNESVTIQAPQ
jgi:hypothetical protein